MSTWQLENADQIATEYKYTFYKPSLDVIQKVALGETVKLIFQFESDDADAPRAERMWVIVDEIQPNGHFKGRLDNDPQYITDLKCGDPVEFMSCHIINTEHDDKNNIVEKYSKRCFVTNRVLRDGAKAGYIYREEPDREDDSGWRITANDESEEYMDDASNSAYVSLGAVLNNDDTFIELLDSVEGSAFIFDSATSKFVRLE